MKPGDILVSTWGYEARLATFFKVIGVTAKSVKLAELVDQVRTGDWMSGTAKPAPNSRLGETVTKRVKANYAGTPCVKINSFSTAYKWDGNPIQTYNHH